MHVNSHALNDTHSSLILSIHRPMYVTLEVCEVLKG